MAKAPARKRRGRGSAGWTQLRLAEPVPAPAERSLLAVSGEVVAVLVTDLAAELGDAAHAAAHQEEATALWRRSGLPEAQFAKLAGREEHTYGADEARAGGDHEGLQRRVAELTAENARLTSTLSSSSARLRGLEELYAKLERRYARLKSLLVEHLDESA